MERNVKLTVGAIIAIVKEQYLSYGAQALYVDDDWHIYHSEDNGLKPDTVCCVTAPPDFDEDSDEEIIPEYAAENGMTYSLLPEIVQDVVIAAVERKRDADAEEMIKALNYYLENDNFMPI